MEFKTFPGAYKKAIETFGKEKQSIVAIEELSELTHELTKMLRGCGDRAHLVEETADAILMIDQIVEMYHLDPQEIQNQITRKATRLWERVNVSEKAVKDLSAAETPELRT